MIFMQSSHPTPNIVVFRSALCACGTVSFVVKSLDFIHKKIRGGDETVVGFDRVEILSKFRELTSRWLYLFI